MLNKKFFASLRNDYLNKNNQRRQIISRSNIILNNAKKAIFAIHRGDLDLASEKLKESEELAATIKKDFGESRALEEGSYLAALEEYAEARLFFNFIQNGKIAAIKELKIPTESYLGGLCDFSGELIRLATNEVIAKNFEKVTEIKKIINDILNELINFDITGYLRTKYDQARGNLKKIEQMDYELSLKNL